MLQTVAIVSGARSRIRAWDALKATKGSVVLSRQCRGGPDSFGRGGWRDQRCDRGAGQGFCRASFKDGIQVNSVPPRPVMTGRRLHDRKMSLRTSLDEGKQRLLTQAGIARYGEPEDIAELMAFLVSAGAQWMTGTRLRIDGGEVKSIKPEHDEIGV